MYTIRTLSPEDWHRYRDHLLRLDGDGRRARFGRRLDDAAIAAHVGRLDRAATRILVHEDAGARVVGAVEISSMAGAAAELAFSVDAPQRDAGLGSELARRAFLAARNRGFRRVHVFTTGDNRPMRSLARRAGMRLRLDGGECEGSLDLPPATIFSLLLELTGERAALYEHARNRSDLGRPEPRPRLLAA
jgi:RimJ/RimL family protein N-acetyltransferase